MGQGDKRRRYSAVIASEAKQSRSLQNKARLDCFVAYATRNDVASDGLNKNSALLDQILLEDRHLELE
jgi:hypothetical protein